MRPWEAENRPPAEGTLPTEGRVQKTAALRAPGEAGMRPWEAENRPPAEGTLPTEGRVQKTAALRAPGEAGPPAASTQKGQMWESSRVIPQPWMSFCSLSATQVPARPGADAGVYGPALAPHQAPGAASRYRPALLHSEPAACPGIPGRSSQAAPVPPAVQDMAGHPGGRHVLAWVSGVAPQILHACCGLSRTADDPGPHPVCGHLLRQLWELTVFTATPQSSS
ncbi:translation initiation factor IF-2 isoform X1 [Pongo abelii]|uniref:translation initiation factor IF-2 isoform X1 n=2 Tax=Pongo abelii TaxID=9601 RepID=UPI003004CA01